MPASPIEIPTSDGRKLAGTLYTPSLAPAPFGKPHQLPALILAPTFTATQTMGAQNWAQHFTSHLWLAVVTFDARGFGQSQVCIDRQTDRHTQHTTLMHTLILGRKS